MSNPAAPFRRSASPNDEVNVSAEESASAAPWLAIVGDNVKSMRYGTVQIVVHDSKVVQIERTERTRFEVPQATGRR